MTEVLWIQLECIEGTSRYFESVAKKAKKCNKNNIINKLVHVILKQRKDIKQNIILDHSFEYLKFINTP